MSDTNLSNMDNQQDAPAETTHRHYTSRPSLFWPLILIGVGAAFLFRNLGYLPGDTWDVIVGLWPLVLVFLGLDGLFRREGFVGPIFLVALGGVFLLSTLNIVQWNSWDIAVKLWPILIIAFGLDLLIARRSTLGAILSVIFLLAILAAAVYYLFMVSPATVSLLPLFA